jgi:hypothetical protein
MIALCRPELVEFGDLGDDRLVVDPFVCDLFDDLLRDPLLVIRMVEDRRAV